MSINWIFPFFACTALIIINTREYNKEKIGIIKIGIIILLTKLLYIINKGSPKEKKPIKNDIKSIDIWKNKIMKVYMLRLFLI